MYKYLHIIADSTNQNNYKYRFIKRNHILFYNLFGGIEIYHYLCPQNNNTYKVMSEDKIKLMRKAFAIRLQNARKMRGLSVQELARSLNGVVSTTAIEKYEKGLMFPQSTSILVAFAEALKVPVGDLLRPQTIDIDSSKFAFRKKAKLGKKAMESILITIKNKIEKYVEVEEIANIDSKYTTGKYQVVIDTEAKARQAAIELRKKWNLGTAPIANPILLLEDHNVMVIEVEEDPTLFDGTSCTINGRPIVIINMRNRDNSNPEVERRRLTEFHEFAHQCLMFPEGMDEKTEEALCNVFANEMLMPSSVFHEKLGDRRQTIFIYETKNLQREYGISVRALMMKAKQLDIITENYYRWFNIRLNSDPELRAIADRNEFPQRHTTRFEQLVIRCLAQGIITESKAAELMSITETTLRDKLNNA